MQSLSRLGDMELPKNVAVQDLACQVLKEKCKVSELWWMPSLDNHVHLCSRLGKPSHESSYWGLMFLNGNPQERHDGMSLQEYGLSRRVTVPCWYNVLSFKSS